MSTGAEEDLPRHEERAVVLARYRRGDFEGHVLPQRLLALDLALAADSHEWQGPRVRAGSAMWLGTKCKLPKPIASTSATTAPAR